MNLTPQRARPGRACISAGAAFALLFLVCSSAHAADAFFESDDETPSPITDRFAMQASFYHASVKTDLRPDPPNLPQAGTPLSGTADLGFRPSENDGLAQLMFRLRDRNRISADFMELDQSGTTTATRQIVFGNEVINPGDVAISALQWRVMGLKWTYAIFQNDRFELGAGLGLNLMDLDVRSKVPARFTNYETSVAGLLPAPALEGAVRITRRFAFTARAEYLKTTLNGTQGSFGNFHGDLQFRWTPNLALGLGYSVVKLNLDSLTTHNPGLIGLRLRGPEAFLRVSF